MSQNEQEYRAWLSGVEPPQQGLIIWAKDAKSAAYKFCEKLLDDCSDKVMRASFDSSYEVAVESPIREVDHFEVSHELTVKTNIKKLSE